MYWLRMPWGALVGMWLTVVATGAGAQVSTQESASVIVFPKVVVDDNWDTTIQIGNGANRPTRAICHYVNGGRTAPDQPPGPLNPPLWAEVDFTIGLARLQPTHWVVSRGRSVGGEPCGTTSSDCDEAGLLPGLVPPVLLGFTGELLCIEVDASGAPWSGNALHGLATLTHRTTGEVIKYPAVGLAGFDTNNADGRLCLGGPASDVCSLGAEYAPCPNAWVVSHPSDFDDRRVDSDASRTSLTVVPCSQSLDDQIPAAVTLSIRLTNELEQSFSLSTSVQCWADLDLGELNDVFLRDVNGGDWLHTEVRVVGSNAGGIMLVQQTVREHARPATFTAVATTPHQNGSGPRSDLIVVTEVLP